MPNFCKQRFLLLLFAFALTLSGCDVFGEDDGGDEELETARVIVGSSGVFGQPSTATLTLYDPETDRHQQDANVNGFLHGLDLRPDGRLYAIVNFGSDNGIIRAYASGAYTDPPVGQIPVEAPPRAIAFAGDGTALVPTQGPFDADFNPLQGDVVVADLGSNTVTDTITAGRQPEDVAITGGKAFVANSASNTLTVIDVLGRTATGTLTPEGCTGPNEVTVDEEDQVVVVCEGGAGTNGAVLFLDPENETVAERVALDVPLGSINFTQSAYYSAEAEALFAISSSSGQVVRIDTDENAFAGTTTVPQSESLTGLSAVAYDAANEQIYVGRLPVGPEGGPDFGSAGTVVILNENGERASSFRVGPSPAHIVLRRGE